ncbi:hypothetical protein CEY12_21615 [Chryseobacterium sp. T16E-39]|uniref:hypothetical protein n=1 Tax=Chryseobacterium sp. T16E-39 TaxID=2015076 RepID=UPI000B5B38ED|nr:hypothetical protein [Chryseobacterium sp. T16E-39]ASK32523.1 hypothetical protein CEY12_21615 [Chryseobacterium sp. T16E-39]
MNDNIINELYSIRNFLDQVKDYVNLIKDKKDIFELSFVQTREHLFEIYNDRLDFSAYSKEYYEGLAETVKRMKNSPLKNVKLSVVEGDNKSCSIFSSEDFSIILGTIFYDN